MGDTELDIMLSDPASRVLALLATGLTTAEAAERLNIAAEVVRLQVAEAMVLLKATSKLELIVKAMRLGLIDLSGADAEPALRASADEAQGAGSGDRASIQALASPPADRQCRSG